MCIYIYIYIYVYTYNRYIYIYVDDIYPHIDSHIHIYQLRMSHRNSKDQSSRFLPRCSLLRYSCSVQWLLHGISMAQSAIRSQSGASLRRTTSVRVSVSRALKCQEFPLLMGWALGVYPRSHATDPAQQVPCWLINPSLLFNRILVSDPWLCVSATGQESVCGKPASPTIKQT